MPVAKVGAEQNVSTGYARRRRRDTALDGGSIPPISTNPLSREEGPSAAEHRESRALCSRPEATESLELTGGDGGHASKHRSMSLALDEGSSCQTAFAADI